MRISDWSSDVCSSDLLHAGPLAPADQSLTTEPRVTPDDDPHLGPGLAQPIHQQTQACCGMLGTIDAAGPQQASEHRLAAQHVHGPIAVMVGVALKMIDLLLAMQGPAQRSHPQKQFLGTPGTIGKPE